MSLVNLHTKKKRRCAAMTSPPAAGRALRPLLHIVWDLALAPEPNAVDLGFGRTVASETEVPNISVNLVWSA